MHPTLLESDRSFLQTAEYTALSVVAHAVVLWFAVTATEGGRQMPTDEREARVFFLLPPDRVDARSRQTDIIQLGKLGSDLEDGKHLAKPSEGRLFKERTYGARGEREESGARGAVPFGPLPLFNPDTAFSVLEVDQMVERFEGSAAPVYPPELLATGSEGMVRAIYVVDTTGRVDTTTIQVAHSDDPRFTASVRNALALMRFRPAKRAGVKVRQLVAQQFRFRITRADQAGEQVSLVPTRFSPPAD